MIAIDLSKQKINADLKAIQQILFTGNLDRHGNTTMFLVNGKVKETILDFLQ